MSTTVPLSQRNVILYRRRWAMLFVNFLLNTANSTVWVAVSSIQAPAVQLYNVSPDHIVLLTNLVYILFIPGTFLSTILLSKYGLYTTSGIGALFLCLASWCRVFSAFNKLFAMEIVASIVFSIGQPLVMNGVAKFGSNWMAPKERFVATMFYNTLPASLGAAILELVAAKHVTGPEQVPAYLLLIAGAVSLISVLFLFVMKERPPTPPEYKPISVASLLRNGRGQLPTSPNHPDHQQPSCCQQTMKSIGNVGRAFQNFKFLTTLIISAVAVLIICAYPAASYNILHPLGYEQARIDDLTAVFFVTGILGAVVIAPLADCARSKWGSIATQLFLVLIMSTALLGSIMLYIHAVPNNFNKIAMWLGVLSFSVNSSVPIALETGASVVSEELNESSSSGLMIACGNLFGFIVVYVIEYGKKWGKGFPLGLIIGITGVGLLANGFACLPCGGVVREGEKAGLLR
jgi:hypothetical protein|tara:strand:+ start:256 stop:1638 length:1383 start_codon:yes stop_codon:yes gene_type:complete